MNDSYTVVSLKSYLYISCLNRAIARYAYICMRQCYVHVAILWYTTHIDTFRTAFTFFIEFKKVRRNLLLSQKLRKQGRVF